MSPSGRHTYTMAVQVNGKMRGKCGWRRATQEEAVEQALALWRSRSRWEIFKVIQPNKILTLL